MNGITGLIHSEESNFHPGAVYSLRTLPAFLHRVKNGLDRLGPIGNKDEKPTRKQKRESLPAYLHEKRGKGKSVEILQAACSFDIETTSVMIQGEKVAFMYVWLFGINGVCIMGRTWEEFRYLIYRVSSFFGLGEKRKLYCYCHQLAYEFQFMRKWFLWEDGSVFALKPVTPLEAELSGLGVVFRCSLLLTGYKLETLAQEKLTTFPEVRKQTGLLDYELIHTENTILTADEITYFIFDIIVVMCYIAQCADDEGGVEKIPRTKTGYVRRRCRNEAFFHKNEPDEVKRKNLMFRYRETMKDLTLTLDEYLLCRRAFAGGFTHGNCYHIGEILHDVGSFDFSSSYPAICTIDYFPMSKGRLETGVTEARFRELCRSYCVIADVTFYGLRPKIDYEFYISRSKCRNFERKTVIKTVRGRQTEKTVDVGVWDNGRVVEAPRLTTSITEIDFDIICAVYDFDYIEIGTCFTYIRGRLPSDLVKIIVDLYDAKTTLKGVKERLKEYVSKKEDLNSIYGMMVTDILRMIYGYTDDWAEPREPDGPEKIEEYNKAFSRFTFYPWGIYVTAHGRRRVWSGILEAGPQDYVYTDTDSIKMLNYEAHLPYIEAYNKSVKQALERACAYHGITVEHVFPKTIKGKEKPLGYWDFEGVYCDFKTLGAKRYLTRVSVWDPRDDELNYTNGLELTCAGVNPKIGARYLVDNYRGREFKAFALDFKFPGDGTGKLTHTYIDEEKEGFIVDYQGRRGHYHELSFVHLSKASYKVTFAEDFIEFLKGVNSFEEI